MPACPLGLNFVPIESTEGFFRQLSASPQVFKDPFSKVLETTRRRGVTRKESQKGFQTVVCRAPPLGEPEVLKIMCLCSICCRSSLHFQAAPR